MKNIFVILKHNLKSIMKGWFLLIIVFPIAINLFLNALINKIHDNQNNMNNSFEVVIYSQDKSEIMDKILPRAKFSTVFYVNNEEDVKKTLDEEDMSVGVIVKSKNIYEDIKNNKENIIKVISSKDDSSKEYVLSVLNTSLSQISSFGNNLEEYNKSYEEYEKHKYKFVYEDTKLEEVIAYMTMFGLFTMAFLFIAGRGINTLLKEKELKIDKRILVSKVSKVEYNLGHILGSKVSKVEYNLGHILGCFVLLFLQSITLVTSFYLFNPDFNVNFFYMILLSFVLSFVGIAVALMVLSISNSSSMYYTLSFYLFNPDFNVNFFYMILLSFVLSFVGIAVALMVLSISNSSSMYYTLLSMVVTPMCLLSGGFVPTNFMPQIFVGIAVALMVLSISNSSSMYYTLLSMVVTPMCLLSGGFVPTNFMPQMVQNFSLVLPLTWVNAAFNGILNNGSNLKIFMDLTVAMSISVVLIMIYLVVENNKKSKIS